MIPAKISTCYDFPPNVGDIKFDPKNVEKDRSRTQQSFAQEADINNIMAKYEKTGFLVDPLLASKREPIFGDFGSGYDFKASADLVVAATGAFNALPAGIRTRFNNDPAALLDFVQDPANEAEAVKLGLLPDKKAVAEPVVPAPAVDTPKV